MKRLLTFITFAALIGSSCDPESPRQKRDERPPEIDATMEPSVETVLHDVAVDVTFRFGRTIGEAKSRTFTVANERFALLAFRPVGRPAKCVQKAFLDLYLFAGSGDEQTDLSFYISSIHHWANLKEGAPVPSRTLIDVRPRADASIGLSKGWVRWDVTRLYRRSLELRPSVAAPAVLQLRPPTFAEPKFTRRFASVEANGRVSPRLVVHVREGCGTGMDDS